VVATIHQLDVNSYDTSVSDLRLGGVG
jgi:hypothetical protein